MASISRGQAEAPPDIPVRRVADHSGAVGKLSSESQPCMGNALSRDIWRCVGAAGAQEGPEMSL